MATKFDRKTHSISVIVIVWALLMLGAIVTAVIAADYPPLGRMWEIRTLIWAFAGSFAGILVAIISRHLLKRKEKGSPSFWGFVSIVGLTILWALIIAGFLHNLPPGDNAFTIPTSPELYLFITALAAFAAFFWLLVWGSETAPGLMLVMLAGTAGGVMFNLHGASTDMPFLMMAALWAGRVWCRRGQPGMSHLLVGGGFLLIIIVIVAGMFGVYPGNSYRLALRMSSGWIVALGIMAARAEKEREVMPALLASGVLLALLTLVRYSILINEFGLDYAVKTRLWIAGADPNALASSLLLTVSILLTSPPKITFGKVLWGLMLLLTLLMMFLSLSKAVWLGLIFLIALGFLISNKNRRRNVTITVVLICLGIIITLAVPAIRSRLTDEFSFSSRIVLWQAIVGNLPQHLLFGVGPGNSFIHASFVNTLPYDKVFPMREYFTGHSHNIWLELTEGIGLVGLVAFLWLILILIRRAEKDRKFLISGLIGLLLTLSLSIGLSVNQFLPLEFWIFLGLIAVPNVRGRRWHFAFAGILVIFAVSGSLSDMLKRQADQWSFLGMNDRAMRRLNIASILNPWDASIPEKQAQLAMAKTDETAMLHYYDKCVALAPGQPVLRAKRGMVRLLTGDLSVARHDLEQAVAGDDFGIISGDLHALLAVACSSNDDSDAANRELRKITTRDPSFPQGPWSALLIGNNDWEVVLCPDFMPGGDKTEQERRVLIWLGSDGVSRSALRKVYPAGTKACSFARAVDAELADTLVLAPESGNLLPPASYQVGFAYYQMRKMTGKEGSDLASLFGGFDRIPLLIIQQTHTTEVYNKAPELLTLTSCLGLARAAQAAGKSDLYQSCLDLALTLAERSPGDLATRVRNMGAEDRFVWPESVASDLANAMTDANKADYEALLADLDGYFKMAILTRQGWEAWEAVADYLIKLRSDGNKLVEDVTAQYPNEPLPILIKAYLAQYYGDAKDAIRLYKEARRLADGNRTVVKACGDGFFALGESKDGIATAEHYARKWSDDLLALLSFQRTIEAAGMVNQAGVWLTDLQKRFPYSADLALLQANYSEVAKDWKSVESFLYKARDLNPVSAPIHGKLAQYYYGQGEKERAIGEYNIALEIDPSDIGSRLGLANIYADKGEFERAVAWMESARQLAPTEAWTNTSLAAVLSRAGRKKEALAVLDAFLEQQPEAKDALVWHAQIADDLGRTDLAVADYNRLISIGHADMSVYVKLAQLLQDQGEIEQAIDILVKGTQINRTNDWGWETLGYIINQADFSDQMEEWFSSLSAINPNAEDLKFLKSQLPVLYKDSSLYKSNITEALKQHPQSSAIKSAWGGVLYREEKLGEADRAFDDALAGNPNDLFALAMKTTIALRRKNSAEALDFATRGQKAAPTSAWAKVLLAQALDASSWQSEAFTVLGQYLASNPDSRYARSWRARLYEKTGDAQNALKDYKLLVELRKGDLTAYVRVAEAKMPDKAGEAVAIMQDATRLYPRSSWAWATYGYMLLQTGEKAKARVAIEKAVKLEPANANYAKLLSTIPLK